MVHQEDVTITFTGQQLGTIELALLAAIFLLVCVAMYSTWPKWSWERRGR